MKKNVVREELENSNASDGDDDTNDRLVLSAGGQVILINKQLILSNRKQMISKIES